jgi:HAD superfamily hydrolase (TIGR01509 family)
MGDVLYDATAWRRWLVKLLARMGLQTHYRGFYQVWDHDYLDEVHRGRRDYHEAFRTFLRSAGLSRGQVDEVEAASHARKRELETGARPLPGVRPTLKLLSEAGLVLAVLSDSESPADQLRQRLARLGLAQYFGPVVSSVELGRTKPDSFCYRSAVAAMNLPAEQVAFVGHDAGELRGARRAALRTIAFNFDPEAVADYYLDRFEQLLPLVSNRHVRVARYQGAA